MRSVSEVADLYGQVKSRIDTSLPDWTAARLSIDTRRYELQADVLAHLERFGEVKAAWLCTQKEVRALPSNTASLAQACAGENLILLEACDGARSIQVRLCDRGWLVVELVEDAQLGDECLATRTTLATRKDASSIFKGADRLVYRVFRRRHAEHGFVPWQARFIGFA